MRRRIASQSFSWCLAGVFTCAVIGVGCKSGGQKKPATQPARLSDRTDAALADPFKYSPDFDRTDISGGKAGNLDKQGMKHDLNSVFNP